MPFKNVHVYALKPLELIYSDIWGPAPVLSTFGTRFYISFLDDASKFLWNFRLALLAHSNLPKIFWEDAFLTAVFIINRLPTPILQHRSPYEMVYHHKPDYNFLRAFGCACWPYLRPYNQHKMDFRSKTCIFIGYSVGHRGYKCLDVSTGKICLTSCCL